MHSPDTAIFMMDCCNKILVVDDSPFNVKTLELMLEHCFNIKCDTAYSGPEALQKVEQRLKKLHKFDCNEYYKLILTDINMPEMDGIQMTRIIRGLYKENERSSSPLSPPIASSTIKEYLMTGTNDE
jgi:two-component system, sensor histidine kinase